MDQYYNNIKEKLIDNEIYERIKDYSKEKHKVITYFEIGKFHEIFYLIEFFYNFLWGFKL